MNDKNIQPIQMTALKEKRKKQVRQGQTIYK